MTSRDGAVYPAGHETDARWMAALPPVVVSVLMLIPVADWLTRRSSLPGFGGSG